MENYEDVWNEIWKSFELPKTQSYEKLINSINSISKNYSMKQKGDKAIIKVLVPGHFSENLKITSNGSLLAIKTKDEVELPELAVKVNLHFDISKSKFNFNKLKAELLNGILTIEVPTKEKNKLKEFEIN